MTAEEQEQVPEDSQQYGLEVQSTTPVCEQIKSDREERVCAVRARHDLKQSCTAIWHMQKKKKNDLNSKGTNKN
jgi:hypothetical protein